MIPRTELPVIGKLTTAKRLGLGFGMLVMVVVVAVALALGRLAAVNAMVERIVIDDWEKTVLANRVIDLVNAQTRDTFLLFHDADRGPLRARIDTRVDVITRLLDELDGRLDDAEGRMLLQRIRAYRGRYVSSFSEVSRLLTVERMAEASALMVSETVPALDALLIAIDELIALQGRILLETGAASLRNFETVRNMMLGCFAAAVLAALVFSSWIVGTVLWPLGGEPDDARAIVERIARGDLSGEIPLQPGDTHSLLAAMQVMQRNLRGLIDARVEAERALRVSQLRLQGLVATLRDLIWEVDIEWRYTYVSPQVFEILGYAPEELLGKTAFDLMPPDEAERVRAIAEVNASALRPIVAFEYEHRHKSGRRVVLESSGRPYFDDEGRLCGYRGLDREITGRKQAEAARLAEALRLRDVLIREVHHRIKNNLQTVVGLLRREANRRPEAATAIDAAIAQVRTVAVVHGLYGRTTRHSVTLGELTAGVLAAASGLVGVPIRLEEASGADALLVKESETVAVALILNELVTNAVKHGLRHRPGPAPRVQLLRDGACGRIRITNAGRLPPGFDFDAGQGLGTGLGLVRALMPAQGMSIRFGMNGPEVEAVITVEAPVLVEDATRSGALLV
jgi:PAS domain S-box-containing protein